MSSVELALSVVKVYHMTMELTLLLFVLYK